MSDNLVGSRKFRILNAIDDCSREVKAIEVKTSNSSRRVISILDRIKRKTSIN
jgi:hypothetical protein